MEDNANDTSGSDSDSCSNWIIIEKPECTIKVDHGKANKEPEEIRDEGTCELKSREFKLEESTFEICETPVVVEIQQSPEDPVAKVPEIRETPAIEILVPSDVEVKEECVAEGDEKFAVEILEDPAEEETRENSAVGEGVQEKSAVDEIQQHERIVADITQEVAAEKVLESTKKTAERLISSNCFNTIALFYLIIMICLTYINFFTPYFDSENDQQLIRKLCDKKIHTREELKQYAKLKFLEKVEVYGDDIEMMEAEVRVLQKVIKNAVDTQSDNYRASSKKLEDLRHHINNFRELYKLSSVTITRDSPLFEHCVNTIKASIEKFREQNEETPEPLPEEILHPHIEKINQMVKEILDQQATDKPQAHLQQTREKLEEFILLKKIEEEQPGEVPKNDDIKLDPVFETINSAILGQKVVDKARDLMKSTTEEVKDMLKRKGSEMPNPELVDKKNYIIDFAKMIEKESEALLIKTKIKLKALLLKDVKEQPDSRPEKNPDSAQERFNIIVDKLITESKLLTEQKGAEEAEALPEKVQQQPEIFVEHPEILLEVTEKTPHVSKMLTKKWTHPRPEWKDKSYQEDIFEPIIKMCVRFVVKLFVSTLLVIKLLLEEFKNIVFYILKYYYGDSTHLTLMQERAETFMNNDLLYAYELVTLIFHMILMLFLLIWQNLVYGLATILTFAGSLPDEDEYFSNEPAFFIGDHLMYELQLNDLLHKIPLIYTHQALPPWLIELYHCRDF